MIKALQTRPSPAPLPELLLRLEETDARERWLAARDLGLGREVECVPYLLRRLADRNLEVRRRAREALLKIGRIKPGPFGVLLKAGLKGLDPQTAILAQAIRDEALGRLSRAREKYARVFGADRRRLWAAYWAYNDKRLLEEIRAPMSAEIARTLNELRNERDAPGPTYPQSALRRAYGLTILAESLGRRIGAAALDLLAAGRPTEARPLRESLSAALAGVEVMSALAKGLEIKIKKHVPGFNLSDADPGRLEKARLAATRARAATELGKYKTPETEKALARAMGSDPSPLVRARAAEALGRLATETAGQALRRAFEADGSLKVRRAAIRALGALPDGRNRDLIYRAVRQDEFKEAALLAIGRRAGPSDLEFLRRAADDETFYTRMEKSPGLGAVIDKESILLAIARALELAAEQKPEPLAALLRQEAQTIRTRALDRP